MSCNTTAANVESDPESPTDAPARNHVRAAAQAARQKVTAHQQILDKLPTTDDSDMDSSDDDDQDHVLPHDAMMAADGVLSLSLQQARAGLALEITTELDASPATVGMYKSGRWDLDSGDAVKTVLKTRVMQGKELEYTFGSVNVNKACCKGEVTEDGRIRCLGCDFTGGCLEFARHTGSYKKLSAARHARGGSLAVLTAGVGNLSLRDLCCICSCVDLHLLCCLYCIESRCYKCAPGQPPLADSHITCSSCPMSFHRACYDSKAGQPPLPADLPEDWQCASCQQAAACAAAGCSWCRNHKGANMDQLFADFKAGWRLAAAQGAAAGPAAAAAAAAVAAPHALPAAAAPGTPAAVAPPAAAAAMTGRRSTIKRPAARGGSSPGRTKRGAAAQAGLSTTQQQQLQQGQQKKKQQKQQRKRRSTANRAVQPPVPAVPAAAAPAPAPAQPVPAVPAAAAPAPAPAQPVPAVAPVAAATPDVTDILTELLALLNELEANDAMLERLEAMMEQVNRLPPGAARLESFNKRLQLQYQMLKTWRNRGRVDKVRASLDTVLKLQV